MIHYSKSTTLGGAHQSTGFDNGCHHKLVGDMQTISLVQLHLQICVLFIRRITGWV